MKIKHYTAGLLTGILIATAIPAIAADEMATVVIDKATKLIIDGQMKSIPSDYSILNYNGRTYLPLRYVAEQTGNKVEWDEKSRLAKITTPEPVIKEVTVEKPVEVIKYVEVPAATSVTSTNSDGTTYWKLPAYNREGEVTVTVGNIFNVDSIASAAMVPHTRLNAQIKNESLNDRIMVRYMEATITTGGKEYKTQDTYSGGWDRYLLENDIQKDSAYAGNFYFPLIPDSQSNFIFRVPVVNQNTGVTYKLEIPFTASLKHS